MNNSKCARMLAWKTTAVVYTKSHKIQTKQTHSIEFCLSSIIDLPVPVHIIMHEQGKKEFLKILLSIILEFKLHTPCRRGHIPLLHPPSHHGLTVIHSMKLPLQGEIPR